MNIRHDKLTLGQIADAFPDELPCIKRNISILRKELKPWADRIRQIRDLPLEYQVFARGVLSIEMTWSPDMPKKKIDHLENLLKLSRFMANRDKGGGIDDAMIERAKAVPIIEWCEFKTKKKSGRKWMVSCPLDHKDEHPSMMINPNNTVKCFSCSFFGDGIALYQAIHQVNFVKAVKALNDQGRVAN